MNDSQEKDVASADPTKLQLKSKCNSLCSLEDVFPYTGGSHLMRISLVLISLLRFFKTFHKYLPYANFGLFILLQGIS